MQIMNAKEGLTTKQVFQNLDYYLLYGLQPDMVVLNIGIVDSYPRPLPVNLNKLLNCLQIGGGIEYMLKKTKLYYKLADVFNFREVDEKKFEYYLENIIKKINTKILLLGIVKPSKILLRSKLAKTNIIKYNNTMHKMALKNKNVCFIDTYSLIGEEDTIYDGYHLNLNGHLKYYSVIKRHINE